jgi:hypothetical protein
MTPTQHQESVKSTRYLASQLLGLMYGSTTSRVVLECVLTGWTFIISTLLTLVEGPSSTNGV